MADIEIARNEPFTLYDRTHGGNDKWRSLRLVRDTPSSGKSVWWLGWDGKKLAYNRDTKILSDYHPETYTWVMEQLSGTPGRQVDGKKRQTREWRIQAAVIKRLYEMRESGDQFEFAGDMNGLPIFSIQGKVRAKANGMMAGEPDIRIYLPGGRLKMIEMKGGRGTLTDSQKERHPKLRDLGFEIAIVKSGDEDTAADEAEYTVRQWLGGAADNDDAPPVRNRAA